MVVMRNFRRKPCTVIWFTYDAFSSSFIFTSKRPMGKFFGKIPRYRRQTCPRLQIFWTTLWQYYFGRNISTFITNFMSGVSTSAIIPWISPLQQPILKLFAFSFHLFHQCVYCVLLSGVFPSFIVSNDHSTQKNVKY